MDGMPALRQGIGDWITFYNEHRPHQSLQPCKDVPKGCIRRKKCLFNCRTFGRGISKMSILEGRNHT
ncbi:MAG: hypothetical protein ACI4TK_12925 [Agathobacter sp.]